MSSKRAGWTRGAFAALIAGGWALGCTHAAPDRVAPTGLAALEAQSAQHPSDAGASLRLAKAYYAAGRFAGARRAVGTALLVEPKNQEAQVYLGLSYEGLAQFDSARAAYQGLLAGQPAKSVQRLLRGRLAIIEHEELVAAARQAIANESLLAQTPPEPNTVAVMPLRYTGTDTVYRPLERGLAAVMITDLSRVRELKVLERARLQVLLDELHLGAGGRVDVATGARSGRLLRAADVVQGQFTTGPASQVHLDATVVRATDAQVAASGSGTDRLQALFDLEKAVVLELVAKLGITLTPAERVAISERPTKDIAAFLLYSRGLEAADAGDFAAAAAAFGAAVERDPGFVQAKQQVAATQAAQTASVTPAAGLAAAVSGGGPSGAPASAALGTAINAAVPSGAAALGPVGPSTNVALPPPDPNSVCDVTNCRGMAATVTIILKLP